MMLIPRGDAVISDCGKFRPYLTRTFGGARPLVCIGANPSTADASIDDQTMRKDQAYARRWGCGWLIKVNIYPWRATDPDDMWDAHARGEDIHGALMRINDTIHSNAEYLMRAMAIAEKESGIVLGAWGTIPRPIDVQHLVTLLTTSFPNVSIQCVATNQDGSPKHTLYTKLSLTPTPWSPPWR